MIRNVWDIAEVLKSTAKDLSITLCNEYCKYQAEFEREHGYNIDDAPMNEDFESFCVNYCDKCPFRWYMGSVLSEDEETLIGKEIG